jgi:hypothetical protein
MISGWVLRMRVRGKKVMDPCMRGSGHSIGLEGGGGGAAILCGIINNGRCRGRLAGVCG